MADEIVKDFKLDSVSLNKDPEEVFDIVSKIGCGSYGEVHSALHKESGHTFAIKTVKVADDLGDIIKEISIMKQCDSDFVVKYYGSYFKNSDLWIVMEYCEAGSISDIIRLRRKTLTEDEIGAVFKDALNGLSYLHGMRKIHRDIKAGNILLNRHGKAKVADFGVSGQLTDTMAKRNTVIGTPFWMAPELIREAGYDMKAPDSILSSTVSFDTILDYTNYIFNLDIWSLGITALEMCEGHPPHIEMHPMRAIFIIPTKPAPTLKNRSLWSAEFWNFTTRCLVKNPEERASSKELLEDKFILNAKGNEILLELIEDAGKILKNVQENNNALKLNKQNLIVDNKPDLTNCSTMISKVPYNNGSNLEIKDYEDGTLVDYGTNASFVDHNGGTTNYHQLQPDHTIIQQTTMDTNRRTSNIEFNGTPRPTSHLDNRTLYRNNYDAQTSKEYPMFNLNDSIEQELPESNSTNSCELNIYNSCQTFPQEWAKLSATPIFQRQSVEEVKPLPSLLASSQYTLIPNIFLPQTPAPQVSNIVSQDSSAIKSIDELNCFEFDENCSWKNIDGLLIDELDWFQGNGFMDESKLEIATGSSTKPTGYYGIVATEKQELPQNRAVLVSSIIECLSGTATLKFKYWTSPNVQLFVCIKRISQLYPDYDYCSPAIENGDPGPALVSVPDTNKEAFQIFIRAENFIFKSGNMAGGFAILDDIEFEGSLCETESMQKTLKLANRAIKTFFPSFHLQKDERPRRLKAGSINTACEVLTCNFESNDICVNYVLTGGWEITKGTFKNILRDASQDRSNFENLEGFYAFIEGPQEFSRLTTQSFILEDEVYFMFSYHKGSSLSNLKVISKLRDKAHEEIIYESPFGLFVSNSWIREGRLLTPGEYDYLAIEVTNLPKQTVIAIDEWLLLTVQKKDLYCHI
uniref:Non-specific serine/threonine protein kinase n=1 Tax=Rhabditophanes sp. KR3021 TaxID=114890 RepID=A0AC35TT58_9BILA